MLSIITLSHCTCHYKIQGATIAMPHTSYRSNILSICCFCPFKSCCFSYKSFRSLHNSFIRSNCARTPSRRSGSIFLLFPSQITDCIIVLLYLLISKVRFERLFALSACSNAFEPTIACTCSLPK